MKDKTDKIAIIRRGEVIENIHSGWICILNKDKKIIFSKGNLKDLAFLRSTAKPIQAIQTIKNKVDFSDKELAIICGSHTGTQKHIILLKEMLKKSGLTEGILKCGIHLPFNEEEKVKLIKKGESPSALHNNCSGKHIGILSVCKKNNYPLNTYLNPSHPLQLLILDSIKELSEIKKISIAIDGCGLPTFALPILNIAKMFSNFSQEGKYIRILNSMSNHPFYAGGNGQIDTEVMKLNKNILCKVGADGIIIACHKGDSLVLKIADGSPRIRGFVFVRLLKKLGWIKENKIKDSPLRNIYEGKIKNIAGLPVGQIEMVNL